MTDVAEAKPRLVMTFSDPNDLPKLWPQLEPMIKEACAWSAGQFNVIGIVNGILSGEYRLAAFFDRNTITGMMVMTVSEFPTGKRILDIMLASGSALKEWLHHQTQLDDYAKSFGCSTIRMIGREGLQRFLTEWKRTAIVLEREIPDVAAF